MNTTSQGLTVEQMRSVVERYLALVGAGTAEQITELYAEDATLEDPAGSDPHHGREAILAFYKIIEPIRRETELISFKAAGNVAVFEFRITTFFDQATIELNPTDIMEFRPDGLISQMRALWGPQDMVRRAAG